MARVNLTDRAVQAAKADPGQRLELHDAMTPGLTLRVTDNGVKSWVLRYRTLDGRARRHKLGDAKRMTLKAARLEAGRLKDVIGKGSDPLAERQAAAAAAKAVTVRSYDDLQDAYWRACAAGEWKPRKKRKRETTLAFEKRLAARHISPVIGRLPLGQVTRAVVKDLLRGMIAKGIGAQTNRVHAIIRQVFAFALSEELAAVNPAVGFETLHDAKPRRTIWRDEALSALWTACEAPGDLRAKDGTRVYVSRPMAIAVQLSLLLLQRRVEVAHMAAAELDLERGTWIIPAERMKGGKPHQVPLPPRAVTLIREALTLAAAGRDEAPPVVFPSPRDPAKPVREDAVTKALAKLRSCIGVDDATVHDLRRTGSTLLTSERIGVSPFIRSQVLGHSTDAGGGASVSAVHYDVNLYMAEKRRALEAWEGLLLEIVGERVRASNVLQINGATA